VVVTGYVMLVRTDVGQALARRPRVPEGDSTYVDTALAEVEKALVGPGLIDDQKQALLAFQLDLYRVRKDDAGADRVLKKLNELAVSPGAATAGTARRFAETKLAAARVAMDRKDYEGVVGAIGAARSAITDAGQQEEALYLVARAMDERAREADNRDESLRDAGLAYMRVVAHFQDVPGSRLVGDALVGCAGVLERLGETKMAGDLYEQAAMQYHTRPAAARDFRERAGRRRATTTRLPEK
jgi:hypothetical protein